ncbi:Substrate-specific component BioY of biotin ECF transporter [Streptococcus oralis]|uniref:Biotin transporter n=1 Tax=Streptococcus oralis TaxID=1303 RepID=A0A139RK38_STROR|nr:biotin transporter BioY [Streptococcus oralis]KXU15112.1 Substrate-specific component BioY of biotin ECF transporter [Streptococcus oralis]
MKKAHIYAIPAIGAALIAVLAQISLPIGPVPFTLQNFAIGLIATVFRPREAVLSVALYLLLGAIGLPVFAGGGAGFHVLVGPSAGYLWFDLVYAGLTSYLIHQNCGYIRILLANLLGDSLVFVGGILSLHFLAGMPLDKALAVGVLPFILPDLGKIIAISFISRPLLERLKSLPYFSR